jgi:hypothetical protein
MYGNLLKSGKSHTVISCCGRNAMFSSVSENLSEGHCEEEQLDASALAGRTG